MRNSRAVSWSSVFPVRRAALSGAVALVCSTMVPAWAEQEREANRLPEVYVTGETEQEAARQPGAVSQVTREEMD